MPSIESTATSLQTDLLAAGSAGSVAEELNRRGMAAPALLFLLGHRPLAFAAGHLLAVAAPVAAVLGAEGVGRWSRLLTAPGSAEHLLAELQATAQPPSAQPPVQPSTCGDLRP